MFTPPDSIPGLEVFTVGSGKYAIKNLEGPITLPCWSGFQSRLDASGITGDSYSADGQARITLGGDMISGHPAIQPIHINAYQYLLNHQHEVQERILMALLTEYKRLQDMYCYSEKLAAALMPNVNEIQQFKKLIGLSAVHLLNVSKDDIAYVGYEFSCTWDREFGLGVMTHKDRIIEIGDASTAFLTWIADRDRDPETANSDSIFIALEEELLLPSKRPWWKFW
ncbi:DUF6985 domain-containing protein [Pseudobacter ginsenosidimutans]|uniref:DUF6985 domain-containing protein n=1 Tax=Pseudobacter ginsenosidimutans TaxID=661488 RepID=A0A4Q7MUC3_9BACT|nr:hypothetical protein [Pseudobacter ginsenosidimutans]QEC42464.1 hypothetical protein FSB84_12455 [Pseudobacter ginsenosidimutans]RZS70683.1 hypothetical protein EV199_2576 [Pseudobacter ginsenosidimutans]